MKITQLGDFFVRLQSPGSRPVITKLAAKRKTATKDVKNIELSLHEDTEYIK